MARPTRKSKGSVIGEARSRTESPLPASRITKTRTTRSSARLDLSHLNQQDDSFSSAQVSIANSTTSGRSTPATSAVPTPLAATDSSSKQGGYGSSYGRHAIAISIAARRPLVPGRPPPGMAAVAPVAGVKRKRAFEIADSDDDDSEMMEQLPTPSNADEQLARRLQHEEYSKDQVSDSQLEDDDEDDEDDEEPPIPSSVRRSARPSASARKTYILDSDEDGDFSDDDLPDPSPAARKRKGKLPIRAKTSTKRQSGGPRVSLKDSDYEDDDEVESEYDPNASDSDLSQLPEESDDEVGPPQTSTVEAHAPRQPGRPRRAPRAQTHQSRRSTGALSRERVEDSDDLADQDEQPTGTAALAGQRRGYRRPNASGKKRDRTIRDRVEEHHPVLLTMWADLQAVPVVKTESIAQPSKITRQLKPFQLEGVAWMRNMEQTGWKGGVLGDEMGLGKTIQAVSLIMSDYPAKMPTLVLVPPVALMQWTSEIDSYTSGLLKTVVYHTTNSKVKHMKMKDFKQLDVIIMSYNSLESMYRKQVKGYTRGTMTVKEDSVMHKLYFHRVILDEAHSIKTRSTMTAKACFALRAKYRWCLTGTPLQNRIGEFFSLIRFLEIKPFAQYFCKNCPCEAMEWTMDDKGYCPTPGCGHQGMQHISVFNTELLNPIQKYGNFGKGREAFDKLRMLAGKIMLRRLKKDHTNAMELPMKRICVKRQFFSEEENDFAHSIMSNGQRKFTTYVAQGVLLNNYANIFGLIMQMRQVANHPDLILKKNGEGGRNAAVCCICDDTADDAIQSKCKHDFCRQCARIFVMSTEQPACPRCHIPLSIDLEQQEMEQDVSVLKKSSIINRINMEQWTSSTKIELLVHQLQKLRSKNRSEKAIIFSQFTTMLQLIEWRLRRAGLTTVMLDGSMTPAQRQASINAFMTDVDIECFLVSLKAGGVALNLTEASHVFIVDPWWNPAAEWQSADRCHRIGQTRPCTITRLCIEDSVESRMVLLQEKKANMIKSTINSDDKAMESLTPEDLEFLFRGS